MYLTHLVKMIHLNGAFNSLYGPLFHLILWVTEEEYDSQNGRNSTSSPKREGACEDREILLKFVLLVKQLQWNVICPVYSGVV